MSKHQDSHNISESEEKRISQGFHEGERWAFEEAAKKHFAHLVNFMNQLLRNQDRSMELAQEAFFLASRAHKQLDPNKGLTPWLFRIARNLAYKEYHKRSKATFVATDEVEETNTSYSLRSMTPREETEKKELWNRIHKAMAKLNDKYRDILILRLIMGLPGEEVAKMLSIPVATVNTRTHRALKQLRKVCSQMGLSEEEVF